VCQLFIKDHDDDDDDDEYAFTKATKPSIHIRDHSVVSISAGDEPSGEIWQNQLTTF